MKTARTTRTPAPDLGDLLTPEEVARRLGMQTSSLTDWRYRRRGPKWVKLGAARRSPVRYPAVLLAEWIAEHVQGGTSA